MHGFTFYFCTSFIICLLVCWCILIDISICIEYKQGDKQSDKKLKAHGEFGTNGVILSVSDIIPDQMTFYSCCVHNKRNYSMLYLVATNIYTNQGHNKTFYLSVATVDRRSLSSDKIMKKENG